MPGRKQRVVDPRGIMNQSQHKGGPAVDPAVLSAIAESVQETANSISDHEEEDFQPDPTLEHLDTPEFNAKPPRVLLAEDIVLPDDRAYLNRRRQEAEQRRAKAQQQLADWKVYAVYGALAVAGAYVTYRILTKWVFPSGDIQIPNVGDKTANVEFALPKVPGA